MRSTSVNLNLKKIYSIDQLLDESKKINANSKYYKIKTSGLKNNLKNFDLNSLLHSNLKFNFNRNNNNNYKKVQRTITKTNDINFYKMSTDNDNNDDFNSNNKFEANCNKDILYLLNDIKKDLGKQNISNKPIKIKNFSNMSYKSPIGNAGDVYKYNVIANSKVLEIRDLRKDNNFFGNNKLSTSYNLNNNDNYLNQDIIRNSFNFNKYRNKKLRDIYNYMNNC